MTEDSEGSERSLARARAKRDFWMAVIRRLFKLRILRVPKGHYYSPIVSLKELEREATRIFDLSLRNFSGVDLDIAGQLALLPELAQFYGEQPFGELRRDGLRYFFDNPWYGRADALFLYAMIRRFRPQRIIEIGSGFSSAVMLDTNEQFMERSIALTFIEPNCRRLRALLKDRDYDSVTILEQRIQHLDPATVDQLGENDILFIDSSHVSKAGSDVNHLLFEVLPRLASGVLVHFHDVLYPFEYSKEWFDLGMSWNEPYILRAFLQFNSQFRVRLWNDYVMRFHADVLEQLMPLCTTRLDFGVGGSLWLQRV
jgi:predicted O-methyltransferase YrrM